eukprot:CAMPEP_0118830492 /NCGR_PEP_ID=MMETSP1162-20130426/27502_1 /TAXON_ID=33656 /ORGANISM="Phaeocystis Sp, Strain CCMP2710" /LENGTH=226 /DNA_ID=CAMNT_0006761829 /DNA_START=40 /DNA_END=717 /DNA_ORIENTATION=-
MSYGQLGDAGIPNRYRVEYCPTSRGSCKACGLPMAEMTPRCGEKMRSHFFDGFEIKWYHPHCFRTSCKSVHDIVGFQRLKWPDQLVVYKQITGANADEGEAGAQRAKEENAMLWSVADAIAGVPKPKLKEALELNGRMFSDKASPFELRHTIADGLLNGRLPPCPWCKCEALEQEGGLITCRGYLEGATACDFKQTSYSVMGSKITLAADALPLGRVPWVAHPVIE